MGRSRCQDLLRVDMNSKSCMPIGQKNINIEFGWWCYQSVGSSEMRIITFAARRMRRIREALGDDPALEATFQEVVTRYSASIPLRTWKEFTGQATEGREV